MYNIFALINSRNCADKKSKEMAMTWKVIAREERKHLICPTCWDLIERIDPLLGEREPKPHQHQAQSHTEQDLETQLTPQSEV